MPAGTTRQPRAVRFGVPASVPRVLSTLRYVRALAAALVFVMGAGPASAVCVHALAETMGETHAAMEMGEMDHAPEEAPCHEAPAEDAPPAPEPAHDCASACCAVPTAPVDDPLTLPSVESHPVPEPLAEAVAEPVEVPAPAPAALPPPPTLRVHLALQRLLI